MPKKTNENTNGLMREYFPKLKDITNYSDEYIAAVTDKIKDQENVLVSKHLSRSIIQKRCI